MQKKISLAFQQGFLNRNEFLTAIEHKDFLVFFLFVYQTAMVGNGFTKVATTITESGSRSSSLIEYIKIYFIGALYKPEY